MISVIFLRPETPENIGFLARCMKNFDLDHLIIISPLCDPKNDAAAKVSMHAKDILAAAKILPYESFFSLSKKFDMVVGTTSLLGTDYNIPRTPLEPQDLASRLTSSMKVALVFGNEASGMSNEELKACTITLAIPTSKKYPAMNISHAAAIIFYELYKKNGTNKINAHIAKASRKELDVMHGLMADIISSADFATEEKKQTQLRVWKKLFEQSGISKREAFAVMGLLRKLNP
jgi:tRNA/rRNA methyltransferase